MRQSAGQLASRFVCWCRASSVFARYYCRAHPPSTSVQMVTNEYGRDRVGSIGGYVRCAQQVDGPEYQEVDGDRRQNAGRGWQEKTGRDGV